ncbi:50S ribosomal protein L21e [Candidatus Woesearchaeota archaeon]|nr:50S ribosomal protein L21e [Candidatus Woesearchaeota archaeon]
MVIKSYGKMHGTRKKLTGRTFYGITRFLQEFKVGDHVHLAYDPSSTFPHPRFQGKTGIVVSKRGKSYEVKVNDMNAKKLIFIRPEHLKLQHVSGN